MPQGDVVGTGVQWVPDEKRNTASTETRVMTVPVVEVQGAAPHQFPLPTYNLAPRCGQSSITPGLEG